MNVPQSTIEKPLTVIDYVAALEQCQSIDDVKDFGEQMTLAVRHDERFTRAVAKKLAAINKSTNEGRTHERTR